MSHSDYPIILPGNISGLALAMRYTEPLVAAENFERAHLDGRHAIRAAPKSMNRVQAQMVAASSKSRMSADEREKRQAIVTACRRMNELGINQGTSGNISLRHGEGMLITPTSVPYDAMSPEQIVFMGLDGSFAEAQKPSSEWRFHLDILRSRSEIKAVVHAHPTYATILSIMGLEIPPIHYMIAAAGGDTIRCAPYATYGTPELSVHAVEALQGRMACLLGHHGMIALGPSLPRALWLAVEVEALARQYHGCLQIGKPPLLSKAEIERVRLKMTGYGHPDT